MLRPALVLLALLALPGAALAQRPGKEDPAEDRRFPVHGLESADDENEGNEPDTPFPRPLERTLPRGAAASGATSGGAGGGRAGGSAAAATPLAAHANAGELLDGLIDGLRELEVDVQLIGGRKYMVNDCLGIKVSAGGFELALGDTVGRFEGSSLVIETGIDHVSVSQVKIRMKPNPNVLELCKFSKKFEIGGDLDDVRLTLVFDPVLNAEQNRIVGIGQPRVTVRIGNLNLKPLQNDLDKMAKNAVEDGLTVFLNIQFMDLVNEALRRLLDPGAAVTEGRGLVEGDRGGRGGSGADSGGGASGSGAMSDLERRIAELERRVVELERRLAGGGGGEPGETDSGAVAGAPPGRTEPSRSKGPGELAGRTSKAFDIVPNPELRGRLGRIVVEFPAGTKDLKVWTQVFRPGEAKELRTDYGSVAQELMPGSYDLVINGRRVPGVAIEGQRDTRVKVGVLRLNSSGKTWFGIFEPGGKEPLQSVYGSGELGFPPGALELEVNGQRETVEIRAGEIVEY